MPSPARTDDKEKGMLPLHRVASARVQRFPQWRWSQLITYLAVSCVLAWTCLSFLRPVLHALLPSNIASGPRGPRAHIWDGWEHLERLFIFGGDWSMTGFDPTGEQPSMDNPLGNPLQKNVSGPGYHPVFGPRGPLWVHYTTLKYNQSIFETFDFATGGATLDRAVIEPLFPTANTFGDQLDNLFLPTHAPNNNPNGWLVARSLFASWFGINDFILALRNLERAPVAALVESYARYLTKLYDAGARNFLLFNLPPMDRPYKAGKPGMLELQADIKAFNRALWLMRNDLMTDRADMNIFFYDVHGLFDKIITKPGSYLATMDLVHTKGPCDGYELPMNFEGTPQLDRMEAKCGIPVNQYFWHDYLHVTYRVHDAIAVGVVEECMSGERKGFCS